VPGSEKTARDDSVILNRRTLLFEAAMVHAADELERGRASYGACVWRAAYESLTRADQVDPLAAEDLELLARSAYMLGRDDQYVVGLERAHGLYVAAGNVPPAVRCAFWIGHNMLFRGETGSCVRMVRPRSAAAR
jgi:hypothetical protein